MLAPLYVRPLTDTERETLKQGLRAKEAFTLRRCKILLASAKGIKASEIATLVGCSVQTVRNTIRAFEQHGLECLTAQPNRPNHKNAALKSLMELLTPFGIKQFYIDS